MAAYFNFCPNLLDHPFFNQAGQQGLQNFLVHSGPQLGAKLLFGQPGFQGVGAVEIREQIGDLALDTHCHGSGQHPLAFRIDHHERAGGNRVLQLFFQFFAEDTGAGRQLIGSDSLGTAFLHQHQQFLLAIGGGQGGKVGPVGLPVPFQGSFPFFGPIVEDRAAADGGDRRIAADHIVIARPDRRRFLQDQLDAGGPRRA